MKMACGLMMILLGAFPQDPASTKTPETPGASAIETEIHAANKAFVEAFAAGDAPKVASLFVADAEVVDEMGGRTVGREAIAARFADLFRDSPGITIEVVSNSIRSLSPVTVIEQGVATIKPADGQGAETSRYEAIYVKQDGKWLQSYIRDFAPEAADPHERLKALEWIVGDWIDESPDGVIETSCAWSPDGNYLLRDFRIQRRGKREATGSQRIGWDPQARQIKSWTFDTDGTHSEQFWAEDGPGRWVVKSSGAMADGRLATATNLLSREGNDRATWTSTNRTIGAVTVGDLGTYTLVRKPPAAR